MILYFIRFYVCCLYVTKLFGCFELVYAIWLYRFRCMKADYKVIWSVLLISESQFYVAVSKPFGCVNKSFGCVNIWCEFCLVIFSLCWVCIMHCGLHWIYQSYYWSARVLIAQWFRILIELWMIIFCDFESNKALIQSTFGLVNHFDWFDSVKFKVHLFVY